MHTGMDVSYGKGAEKRGGGVAKWKADAGASGKALFPGPERRLLEAGVRNTRMASRLGKPHHSLLLIFKNPGTLSE